MSKLRGQSYLYRYCPEYLVRADVSDIVSVHVVYPADKTTSLVNSCYKMASTAEGRLCSLLYDCHRSAIWLGRGRRDVEELIQARLIRPRWTPLLKAEHSAFITASRLRATRQSSRILQRAEQCKHEYQAHGLEWHLQRGGGGAQAHAAACSGCGRRQLPVERCQLRLRI